MTWIVRPGNAFATLAELSSKSIDVTICDPPYDDHVHAKVRSGHVMPDDGGFACRARRSVALGFDSLSLEGIDELAYQYARLTKRWIVVFSNVELCGAWREAFVRHGLDYVRTGAWHKLRATPQFTGDRPATAFETITIAHPKGRKKWNGGGTGGLWAHPVVANCNGHRRDRQHTTQKPLGLMLDLVRLFSNPGELILDSHCGSGTTGVAALRLGRSFIGCEVQKKYVRIARERLGAEQAGMDLSAYQGEQVPMFPMAG